MNNRGISANSGYVALAAEVTPGVPVRPIAHYVPLTDESMTTELNANTELHVFGSKAARLMTTPGMRSHGGDLTVLAEPNSTALFFSGLFPRTGITANGDGTFTWEFNSKDFAPTSTFTIDVSKGISVTRFAGAEFGEISPSWKDGRQSWKVKTSALKSFTGAVVASVAGAVVTLEVAPNKMKPTELLAVGDTIGILKADNSTVTGTVSSKTDATVTLGTAPAGVAAGDVLHLRPQPSVVLEDQPAFLWGRTEFCMGATAAAALAATHTPVEDGSEYVLQHPFEDDKGTQSSGSFDPGMLVRSKSIDATLKIKNYFADDRAAARYDRIAKSSIVVRSFSTDGQEFRLTLNNLACTKGGDKPLLKVDEALFYEREYVPNYDRTDGQMLDIKVICKLSGL